MNQRKLILTSVVGLGLALTVTLSFTLGARPDAEPAADGRALAADEEGPQPRPRAFIPGRSVDEANSTRPESTTAEPERRDEGAQPSESEDDYDALDDEERLSEAMVRFEEALAMNPPALEQATDALSLMRAELYPERLAEYEALERRLDAAS